LEEDAAYRRGVGSEIGLQQPQAKRQRYD